MQNCKTLRLKRPEGFDGEIGGGPGGLGFMPEGTGGLSQEKEADAEIQKICDDVKLHADKMSGKTYEAFTAKTYSKQTVYGYNYFIKVHVGGDSYIHLLVFENARAGSGFVLKGIQDPKTLNDPIESFYAW